MCNFDFVDADGKKYDRCVGYTTEGRARNVNRCIDNEVEVENIF